MEKAAKLYADIVLYSNALFTGLETTPGPGAVAIKDNVIMAVGTEADVGKYIDSETIEYHFKENLVMPGFHDSHLHVIDGSLYENTVKLHDAVSEKDAARMVWEFSETVEEDGWIIGFGWYHTYWSVEKLPTKDSLDEYLPDRPVLLQNDEGHGCWVNSKALSLCGIDKNTPDPPYGKIFRDESGNPTGYLDETAMELCAKTAYDLSRQKELELISGFIRKASRNGITSVNDMKPLFSLNLGSLASYKNLEETGDLNVRIHVSTSILDDIELTKKLRSEFATEKIRHIGLKGFIDGVVTTHTALMLEPYTDLPDSNGSSICDTDTFQERIIQAEAENIPVHLHACGDGAVRLALDWFEESKKVNKQSKIRHSIEHAECIHPDDTARFSKLNVTASMQPRHLAFYDIFEENPYCGMVGEARSKFTWIFRTLLKNDTSLAFGSDYPVVELNPLQGIYHAVTREADDGKPEGGWIPDERITLSEALRAYTFGGAYMANRENELGTIEEGKFADIVVLDTNLFNIPPRQIKKVKVIMTIMDGKIVYRDDTEF